MLIPSQEGPVHEINPDESIQELFTELVDPRLECTKKHKLLDIVVIALGGVICRANTWVDIQNFGNAKAEWFGEHLQLSNGITSHDTIGRVFFASGPAPLASLFSEGGCRQPAN